MLTFIKYKITLRRLRVSLYCCIVAVVAFCWRCSLYSSVSSFVGIRIRPGPLSADSICSFSVRKCCFSCRRSLS